MSYQPCFSWKDWAVLNTYPTTAAVLPEQASTEETETDMEVALFLLCGVAKRSLFLLVTFCIFLILSEGVQDRSKSWLILLETQRRWPREKQCEQSRKATNKLSSNGPGRGRRIALLWVWGWAAGTVMLVFWICDRLTHTSLLETPTGVSTLCEPTSNSKPHKCSCSLTC